MTENEGTLKTVNLDIETHKKLKNLATNDYRTIRKQLVYLINNYEKFLAKNGTDGGQI